jgi:hypothetical protein
VSVCDMEVSSQDLQATCCSICGKPMYGLVCSEEQYDVIWNKFQLVL